MNSSNNDLKYYSYIPFMDPVTSYSDPSSYILLWVYKSPFYSVYVNKQTERRILIKRGKKFFGSLYNVLICFIISC